MLAAADGTRAPGASLARHSGRRRRPDDRQRLTSRSSRPTPSSTRSTSTSGHLKLDRPQRFSNVCPALYGFVPRRIAATRVAALAMRRMDRTVIVGDGDPLDVCVLTRAHRSRTARSSSGARPIGGLRLLDRGEADDKIVAVLLDDATFGGFRELVRRAGARSSTACATISSPTRSHPTRRRRAVARSARSTASRRRTRSSARRSRTTSRAFRPCPRRAPSCRGSRTARGAAAARVATGSPARSRASSTRNSLAFRWPVVDEVDHPAVVLGGAPRVRGTNTGSPQPLPAPKLRRLAACRAPGRTSGPPSTAAAASAPLAGSRPPRSRSGASGRRGARRRAGTRAIASSSGVELHAAACQVDRASGACGLRCRPCSPGRARRSALMKSQPVVARDVEHELVALVVGVHGVEDVAGVGVEPAHVGVAAVARHDAEPRAALRLPRERAAALPSCSRS